LESRTVSDAKSPKLEPRWTWKEVADYLKVGRSTVFKLAADDLPCFHAGRQLRFDPDRVRAWEDSQHRSGKRFTRGAA